MASSHADSPGEGGGPPPHRRRKRYSGTHPRRFDEKYKELAPRAYPEMAAHVRERGQTPAGTHVPIMVEEVMACLSPSAGEVVADCTLGYGGHAMEFLRRIGPTGRLVGFDVDRRELERTRTRLLEIARPEQLSLFHSNYAGIGNALAGLGLEGYDIIFADLGVSSMQIDDPARGFTYKHDGPLDMRMDERVRRTAADVLATSTPEELATALHDLADEPDAERIARAIAQARGVRPIRTTGELTEIVLAARGLTRRNWRELTGSDLHPAARTFQALRIMVNDELGALRELLRAVPYCLKPGGRIGIITFHSGEDRMVKHAFREGVAAGLYAEAAPEVIRPSARERHDNPRSAPAKLRWARKQVMSNES